jgi:hypothetical protein
MSAAAAGEARASALAAPNIALRIYIIHSLFLVRLFVARQSKRGNPLLGS